MSDVHLSIIIATVGRPTLLTALASLEPQMEEGDEILVIPDYPRHGGWGYVAHNKGMRLASGTHLIWIGDDDDFLPEGLAIVRAEVGKNPLQVHLFSVLVSPNRPMPGPGTHDIADVLALQGGIVVPRSLDPMPLWRPDNGADKLFAAQAIANSHLPPRWHPVAIGRWRTHKWPGWQPNSWQPEFSAFDQMHTYLKEPA